LPGVEAQDLVWKTAIADLDLPFEQKDLGLLLVDGHIEDRSPDGDDRRRGVDPIGIGLAAQLLDLDPGLALEQVKEGTRSRFELLHPDGCFGRDDRLGSIRESKDEASIPTRRDRVSRKEGLPRAQIDPGFDRRDGGRGRAIGGALDLDLSLEVEHDRAERFLRHPRLGECEQHPQDKNQPDLNSVHTPSLRSLRCNVRAGSVASGQSGIIENFWHQ
jgi:hypothetical protein